jgi:hypothetical protein
MKLVNVYHSPDGPSSEVAIVSSDDETVFMAGWRNRSCYPYWVHIAGWTMNEEWIFAHAPLEEDDPVEAFLNGLPLMSPTSASMLSLLELNAKIKAPPDQCQYPAPPPPPPSIIVPISPVIQQEPPTPTARTFTRRVSRVHFPRTKRNK